MTELAVRAEGDQMAVQPKGGRPAQYEGCGATVLRDSWDAHATEWIAWVRAPEQPDSYWRFHRDRFLPLVPDPGRLTLDIGCGEGRVGRDLQERGHTVLGVDWSSAMCKAAATYPGTPVPVVAADASQLPIQKASVDCAIAFMSLQDIDDMPGALKEIARVLEDGKKLALAIVHPMYSGGKQAASAAPNGAFVIKRSYFEPEILVSEDGHDGMKVTFFREHRPLEAYVKALFDAGFSIDQLHEVTDQDQGRLVPMFLDILATRQPRPKEQASPSQPHDTRNNSASLPSCSIREQRAARDRGICRIRGSSAARGVIYTLSGAVLTALAATAIVLIAPHLL
jgi:SAM-dependent methyltransferase